SMARPRRLWIVRPARPCAGVRRRASQWLASAPAHPPPSAWTISMRSPGCSTCVGCRPRGTISPFTSTATRRSPRPCRSSSACTVVPSAMVRASPLSWMSMPRLSPDAPWPAPAGIGCLRQCGVSGPAASWTLAHRAVPYWDCRPHFFRSFRMVRSPTRPVPATRLLAAALALAAAPALAADTFSRTVFFGDSLTDAGYFRPLLVQQDPAAAILGRFTTNPGLVWAEWLADYYG